MPMVGSKPSISASSWLSVCSRSSLATTAPWPARRWPIASISSMKMIAGRPLARLGEQVADPGRADADEHLHEAGAGDREEGHLRLARHRAGEQRLAGTRRADHEHAARHHGPGPRVAVGVAQEVDDLADLGLRPVVPGDVGELGGGPLLVEHLGAGPADAENALHLAGRATGQPPPEPEEEQERRQDDYPVKQLGAEAGRRRGAGDLHAVGLKIIQQRLAGLRRDDHGVVRPVGQRPAARTAGLGDGNRLHRVLAHVGEELRVGQRGLSRRVYGREVYPEEQCDENADWQQPVPPLGRRRRRVPGAGLSPGGGGLACLLIRTLPFPPGGRLCRARSPALSTMPAQQAYVIVNVPALPPLPGMCACSESSQRTLWFDASRAPRVPEVARRRAGTLLSFGLTVSGI